MNASRFPPPIPPLDVAAILRQNGIRADKRLGQNFLQDPYALEKVVAAAEIRSDDSVLEIGAGMGNLTRYLAASAGQVVAVEVDERLFPVLEANMAPYQNARLIQADVLQIEPGELIQQSGYLVVANIPYYITSALIRHLLEDGNRPRRIALTLQKEVAERICAGPGDMSILALSVQVYGRPSTGPTIPAGAFYPVPKVDSAVLVVDIYPAPQVEASHRKIFFQLIKAGFSQKRKKLRNSLAAGMRCSTGDIESLLGSAGIDPNRRAETLSLDEWKAISEMYAS